jgi:uncharacterized membrane protein
VTITKDQLEKLHIEMLDAAMEFEAAGQRLTKKGEAYISALKEARDANMDVSLEDAHREISELFK